MNGEGGGGRCLFVWFFFVLAILVKILLILRFSFFLMINLGSQTMRILKSVSLMKLSQYCLARTFNFVGLNFVFVKLYVYPR